jgi:hypothetical protein
MIFEQKSLLQTYQAFLFDLKIRSHDHRPAIICGYPTVRLRGILPYYSAVFGIEFGAIPAAQDKDHLKVGSAHGFEVLLHRAFLDRHIHTAGVLFSAERRIFSFGPQAELTAATTPIISQMAI